MKQRFKPDPCQYGCVWASFSPAAMEWWGLFRVCTKQWETKDKEVKYEIDWGAVDVSFRAYNITDEKFGMDMIFRIISMLSSGTDDLSDEQVIGWEDIPDE